MSIRWLRLDRCRRWLPIIWYFSNIRAIVITPGNTNQVDKQIQVGKSQSNCPFGVTTKQFIKQHGKVPVGATLVSLKSLNSGLSFYKTKQLSPSQASDDCFFNTQLHWSWTPQHSALFFIIMPNVATFNDLSFYWFKCIGDMVLASRIPSMF